MYKNQEKRFSIKKQYIIMSSVHVEQKVQTYQVEACNKKGTGMKLSHSSSRVKQYQVKEDFCHITWLLALLR